MASRSPGRALRPPPARAPVSVVEREALDFLGTHIQPYLRRGEQATLARAVSTACRDEAVGDLAKLNERQRRELLAAIEARLHRGRAGPTPRALVHLTTVIARPPEPLVGTLVPSASPAR